MADIVSDMRRAYELKGDTYSSMEIFGMLSRAANEIERLRAAVDIALEAFRQIDRKSAEYLVALNIHKGTEP